MQGSGGKRKQLIELHLAGAFLGWRKTKISKIGIGQTGG